jgi:hypothetical protein
MACIPDIEHPIRYLHTDPEGAAAISKSSALPWGLATLTIAYRYVFEGQALPQ